MKRTLITIVLGIVLFIILSATAEPQENTSTDPVWDYCQKHYPEMTYDYYLDVFTETDEYEELYNSLID